MIPSLPVVADIQVHKVYSLHYIHTVNNHTEAVKIARTYPAGPKIIRASRYLLIAVMFCVVNYSTEALAQTAIAVARNSTEVSLAADSKSSDIKTRAPSAACKIRQVGEFWIAIAGHHDSQMVYTSRRGASIDLWADIDKAIKTKGSQRDQVEAFGRIFRISLGRLMNELRLHNEPQYRDLPPRISSVIFASVDKGVPVYFIRDFFKAKPIDPKENPLFSTIDPVDIDGEDLTMPLKGGEMQVTCRGACKDCQACAAESFIADAAKSGGIDLGPVDLTHFIVAYSVLVEPKSVGPPIEVLRITKDGKAKWEQQETCKNDPIEKPKPTPSKGRGRRK